MSRINTNVGSLLAQRILNTQQTAQQTSLERLSTGLQINRGKDNPAGLIASQRLGSEVASINAAAINAQRADQVASIADGGLQEVSSLLLQVQGLVGQSANQAGLSTAEKQANQLQIDSILQSIDRISSTTSFQGTKLLNGTFDFSVTSQSSLVTDFQINAAKLPFSGTRQVQVLVTTSAQHGALYLSLASSGLDLGGSSNRFVFEVAGSKGSRQFTFASGTTLDSIASAVNTFKDVTGVSAVASTQYLNLKSTEFGTSEFVSFKLDDQGTQTGGVVTASTTDEASLSSVAGTSFASLTNAIKDSGQDVGAIINGITATAAGKNASINTDFLNLTLTLNTSGAQISGGNSTINAFTITGGGANFNLGPSVDITNAASLGIQNVATNRLGNSTLGYLSQLASGQDYNVVNGDVSGAQKAVNAAIDQISTLRGRIGAFQANVVAPTINNLGVALENTSAAQSAIQDTNFASETSNLTRSQILVSAATNVLALANSAPQSVLQLLG